MQLATRRSDTNTSLNSGEWRIAHAPEPAPIVTTRSAVARGARAIPFKDPNTTVIAPSLVGVRTTVRVSLLQIEDVSQIQFFLTDV